MSVDDLATALKAIDDEEIRRRVAAGDLSAAGELDLTEHEQSLLRAAADDYPEVSGFGFGTLFTERVGPEHVVHKHIAGVKYEDLSLGGGVQNAFDYVAQKGLPSG